MSRTSSLSAVDGGRRTEDSYFGSSARRRRRPAAPKSTQPPPLIPTSCLLCSVLLPLLSKAPEATGRERARCQRERGRRNTQWPPGRKGRSPLHTTRRRRRRRRRRVRRTNRAHPREQRVRRGGARTGRKDRVGEEGREDDLIGRATATWRKNSSRAHRPTLLTMD